jgi:hypothetical protein
LNPVPDPPTLVATSCVVSQMVEVAPSLPVSAVATAVRHLQRLLEEVAVFLAERVADVDCHFGNSRLRREQRRELFGRAGSD